MNSKVQLGIKAVLIVTSVFLTVRIYQSIMQPINFQRIENTRLCEVTEQLENIREAQLAYKERIWLVLFIYRRISWLCRYWFYQHHRA